MALIPPDFLNTVAALGETKQNGEIEYNATGFLYGYPSGRHDDDGNMRYHIYLVTNRHVYEKALKRQKNAGVSDPSLRIRLNKPIGTESEPYKLRLVAPDGTENWTVHPEKDVDVAVVGLNVDRLETEGLDYAWFGYDIATMTREQAVEEEISEGDGVFVLGFPLGETGERRNYTIVRQGIIARARDWLNGDGKTFLLDAMIFPGNSGGPVLLKPELFSIEGTKATNNCALLGMVSGYLPYRDVAVSLQSERPRMIIEENSGLAVVVPHDSIHETVKIAVEKLVQSNNDNS